MTPAFFLKYFFPSPVYPALTALLLMDSTVLFPCMLETLTIALLITACIYIALAVITLTKNRTPACQFFSLMMLLAAVWSCTYAGELYAETLITKIRFLQIRLMFICFIPFAWLGLVMALTGKLESLKKTFVILLLIVPTTTAILSLTTLMHNQFRYDFAIETAHGLNLLIYKRSRWDMIHEASNHLVSLLGFFMLLAAWHNYSGSLRKQTTLLGISFVIPLSINILFILRIIPTNGINPTPFVLLPSSILQAWVVLRSHILEIIPIARSIMLDHIDMGMIVVNRNQQVIDINSAALTITSMLETQIIGSPVSNFPPPWNELFSKEEVKHKSVKLIKNKQPYWIRVELIPIVNTNSSSSGNLVILRNITSDILYQQKEKLKQEHNEQQKQLKLQQLLLRDIHDGLGGLASNLLFMAVFAQNEQDTKKKDEWLKKIERTSEETNIEIHDLMNAFENTTMQWSGLIASIRRSAQILFDKSRTKVEFYIGNIPIDDDIGLVEGLSVARMARECMNNIVKHADATEIHVEIDLSPENMHICIKDNGSGFDPDTVQRGRGLNNLAKRSAELGGDFCISFAAGTCQSIDIPFPLRIVKEITP